MKTQNIDKDSLIKTNIFVKEVSVEDMLNDKDAASYNPSIWKNKVNQYSKYEKCQFYKAEKSKGFEYERFFVSYISDGIYFFNSFGYGYSMTSAGFKIVLIIDNEVLILGFTIPNNDSCRELIRRGITSNNLMVSNEF